MLENDQEMIEWNEDDNESLRFNNVTNTDTMINPKPSNPEKESSKCNEEWSLS